MKPLYPMCVLLICFLAPSAYGGQPLSDATGECLSCHEMIHPGIVSSWKKSRHAATTPSEALKVEGLDRKVSSPQVPEEAKDVVVGCAECHAMAPKTHADTFEHNGHDVHTVVSSRDCGACHAVEAEQYQKNIMAQAHGNLTGNDFYRLLTDSINGGPSPGAGPLEKGKRELTDPESCLYCHGTVLKVSGLQSRETDLGSMDFPVISGWPNQGVGRINPDGSKGSCSACHTRHEFSMAMARKPYTCKECHSGPDVPATKVYEASKHGNLFSSKNSEWDFTKTQWTVGRDFTAPTCAACHISLLVSPEGQVVAQRTHEIKDRLPWRLFGLFYAHPHPREPDTTIIRNKDGLSLPTDFGGGFSEKFLLTGDEAAAARQKIQSVCLGCHARSWVDGHWRRFLNTIETTNAATLTATQRMQDIWKRGLATGQEQGGSPFDESIEKTWTGIWLFYANTIRFASAMAGGGDYGVFADGRYQMQKAIREMEERVEGGKADKEDENKGGKEDRPKSGVKIP